MADLETITLSELEEVSELLDTDTLLVERNGRVKRFTGEVSSVDATLTVSGQAADAKATGDAIEVERSRITNLATLGEGSTTGDAELQDIRVGADGTTYSNAGTAVREQISDLKEELEHKSGLSDEAKQALLACFEQVAWIGDDGQDYYDALESALYPPADLVSISANYTQSGDVYDTDSLDSLKADLVVTALYDDQTTGTVTNYTLSGTLEVGTSTITVAYGGKTTSFTVTVTEKIITITTSSDGVGFGAIDTTKPAVSPPYISNSNKSRIHYLGTNNLGIAINPNKTYKISITTNLTTCQLGVYSFNNTAKNNILNLQTINAANVVDGDWQDLTEMSPYIYTPPASINGEEPVMAWLVFRRSTSNTNWSDLNDSIFPVTVKEL